MLAWFRALMPKQQLTLVAFRGKVALQAGHANRSKSIADLRSVIEPATLGDPMRPLLWVSKSHNKVAEALRKQGHEISASSVKRLLPAQFEHSLMHHRR